MLVAVESRCVVDPAGCEENVRKALSRNLPYCRKLPARAGSVAVVAAGPSVRDYLDEIKAHPEIWAINGAYDFLLSMGVVPTGFVGCDPLPGLAAYVSNAHPKTRFYISAICDESVLDALDDQDVMIWYPQRDQDADKPQFACAVPKDAEIISGGTTSLTRAPFLARCLGFTEVTLYGADSSFEEGRYCYRDGTYPDDSQAQIQRVMINDEGPFFTEMPLLMQVSQLGVLYLHQTWGVNLKIKCRGLMDAYLRAPLEADIDRP